MKTDQITNLFDNLKGQFDIEDPKTGHQQRFLEKLNSNNTSATMHRGIVQLFKPWIGIAASVTLIISLFFGTINQSTSRDLASISPEMAETQAFFVSMLETELDKLQVEQTPEFQNMIVDALFQIEGLEQNYNKLKQDLDDSGNDKRVIHAMISNFQNRIDILQNVLTQIEELKQLNTINNENSSTL